MKESLPSIDKVRLNPVYIQRIVGGELEFLFQRESELVCSICRGLLRPT